MVLQVLPLQKCSALQIRHVLSPSSLMNFFPVYYRPALKDYLAGRITEDKLWARPAIFYQQQQIRCISGHVIGINSHQQFVQLHDGQQLGYDKLLLANGARPRQLSCPGNHLGGVMTLRTIADYQHIRQHLTVAKRIIVYGSGTLALETAEGLHHQGYMVTHLMRHHIIWPEILDETASDLVLHEERRLGIDVHVDEEIVEIRGVGGQVAEVLSSRGECIPCDMLLIAIGIEPQIDFARASGIACGRGVTVDIAMRTNTSNIYAAGDVVETTDALTGRTRVAGRWYPAIQQARIAAASMLGKLDARHPLLADTFYNATFLCDLAFVSLGVTTAPLQSALQVIVADPRPRTYQKILLSQGVPVGALLLGDRTHALAYKRAIDHRMNLLPVLNHLFASDFNLDAWLDYHHVPPAIAHDDDDWLTSTPALRHISGNQTYTVVGREHRTDTRTLTAKHVGFEIDMCIGCNRCMDVCPVPLSSQVTIFDLNRATVSDEIAPHVSRFTQECILCGSCVPVCPVDNHRDLLMVSLKERLGSSWESGVDPAYVQRAVPPGWHIPALLSRLRMQRVLSDPARVSDNYLLHMISSAEFQVHVAGETILREGEYGRDLYMILDGTLALSTTDSDRHAFPLALLQPGEFVRGYGLLTGQPHPTTVLAQTPVLLLRVPEQVMQRLMELVPGMRAFFEHMLTDHSLPSILKRMALFQDIPDAALQYLIDHALVKQYDRNVRLFAEAEMGRPARETLHVLLEGFIKVARQKSVGDGSSQVRERIIAYRQRGDYFAGGLDLLGDSRAVTATTINRVSVAEIPHDAMLTLFQHYPEVERRFKIRVQAYIDSSLSTQTDVMPAIQSAASLPARAGAASKAALHVLVNDGVVEGTEVLAIDLDTCIHCNECEEACTRRHGRSRMNRNGKVVRNLNIVTACRHCQDPVCMLCSRAGIARLPNGEVYITDSCIGCGICAERCPYHAISIVDVMKGKKEEEIEESSSWQRFNTILRRGIVSERNRPVVPVLNGLASPTGHGQVSPGPLERKQPHSALDEMRKKVAIKCDLCAGYNDQACVQACPTGAAFRVRPATFFGSTEDILQR